MLDRYQPGLEPAERDRLAAMAEGSPGRALSLAAGNGVGLAELVSQVLETVPTLTVGRAHDVADALGRDDEAFATFMDLLRTALAARGARRGARPGRSRPDQADRRPAP